MKITIQIATFNVRTLNRIDQLPELTASAIDHNRHNMLKRIQTQEHRYLYSEDIKYHHTGNGRLSLHLHWKTVNGAIRGVGMLIGPRALKSLNSIEKKQLRVMVTTFNGNPSATIISGYSPTIFNEETDLIAFYNELYSLVHRNTMFSSMETWMPIELRGIFFFWGCVLRSPNCHGKDTAEPTKECGPNNNNRTLLLVPAQQ